MENKMRVRNAYMIFFDGVRVDHLVGYFNTSHSVDGGIPRASIQLHMSFGAGLSKQEYDAEYRNARANIINMRKIFKKGTKVIIAMKNVVTGNYRIVFNGSINRISRSNSFSKRYVGLSIGAMGSMESASMLESVLSLPLQTYTVSDFSSEAFKLKARGLDLSNAKTLESLKNLKMSEMTIAEIKAKTSEALLATNTLYRNEASTQNFERIMDRIRILSDIDKTLIKGDLVDLSVDISTMKVETIYTTLAKMLSRIMFEFYEAPWGDVLIKAPFWNTPVLRNHIIPSIFISDESDSMDYDSMVTRGIVAGGMSQTFTGAVDEVSFKFAVPMALYVENLSGAGAWADILNTTVSEKEEQGISLSEFNSLWKGNDGQNLFNDKDTGDLFLDTMTRSGFLRSVSLTSKVKYLEFANTQFGQPVRHIGWPARVVSIQTNPLRAMGSEYAPRTYQEDFDKDKTVVMAEYIAGPYKGFKVLYGGIRDMWSGEDGSIGSREDEILKDGTLIGRAALPSAPESRSNMYITVMYPDFQSAVHNGERSGFLSVSPIAVFRDYYSKRESPTITGTRSRNINELTGPTDAELLYGMRYFEESQPIIRFLASSNSSDVVDALRRYAAFGLKARNASASTMNLTTAIPMPWLIPGFNLWVDPEGIDEVYYIRTVSHYGSAGEDCGTSLFMSMGRDAEGFFNGDLGGATKEFGTIASGGTFGSNVFLSTDSASRAFFNERDVVDSFSEKNHYSSVKTKAVNFALNGAAAYNVSDDPFLKFLYDNKAKNSVGGGSCMADYDFSGEYTELHLETSIKALFESGTKSGLIKSRHKDIAALVMNVEFERDNR
jgi:hypothetical protein